MERKRCICCGEMKPLTDFYRHNKMKDGHLNKCIECVIKYEKKNYKSKRKMTLDEYQQKAMTTRMDSCNNFSYMFINLVGEVGEFASKIAKQIRKGNMRIGETDEGEFNSLGMDVEEVDMKTILSVREELQKEAGDILWQISGLCDVMGWSLEEIAQMNLDKLKARKMAGTIDGSGDGILREK